MPPTSITLQEYKERKSSSTSSAGTRPSSRAPSPFNRDRRALLEECAGKTDEEILLDEKIYGRVLWAGCLHDALRGFKCYDVTLSDLSLEFMLWVMDSHSDIYRMWLKCPGTVAGWRREAFLEVCVGWEEGFMKDEQSTIANPNNPTGVFRYQVRGKAYYDMMLHAVQEQHEIMSKRKCHVVSTIATNQFERSKQYLTKEDLRNLLTKRRFEQFLPPPASRIDEKLGRDGSGANESEDSHTENECVDDAERLNRRLSLTTSWYCITGAAGID